MLGVSTHLTLIGRRMMQMMGGDVLTEPDYVPRSCFPQLSAFVWETVAGYWRQNEDIRRPLMNTIADRRETNEAQMLWFVFIWLEFDLDHLWTVKWGTQRCLDTLLCVCVYVFSVHISRNTPPAVSPLYRSDLCPLFIAASHLFKCNSRFSFLQGQLRHDFFFFPSDESSHKKKCF